MEPTNEASHWVVAETVGFEPTEGFNTLTVLAGPRTRPYYATSPCTTGTATEDTGRAALEPIAPGGECGIRTRGGGLRLNSFQDCHLRPLGQLSTAAYAAVSPLCQPLGMPGVTTASLYNSAARARSAS